MQYFLFPPKNYFLFHILLLTTLLEWAAEHQMLMSWPANTAMQSMSTYQFFIDDPREQWMFTEVLHHPEVDFLHICDGIYQTLTQTDKHTETINTALRKILKLCYLLIWTHLSKKQTHSLLHWWKNNKHIYESLFFDTVRHFRPAVSYMVSSPLESNLSLKIKIT